VERSRRPSRRSLGRLPDPERLAYKAQKVVRAELIIDPLGEGHRLDYLVDRLPPPPEAIEPARRVVRAAVSLALVLLTFPAWLLGAVAIDVVIAAVALA
jgi:hypothetical protein